MGVENGVDELSTSASFLPVDVLRAPGAATRSMTAGTLHPKAFATLLMLACMFGANHVAARVAFNDGVDVATAVASRSLVTTLCVLLLLKLQGVPLAVGARHRRVLLGIGMLISVQSLCLYGAVARLPVALALLAFNTFPLWAALWSLLVYGRRPERKVLLAMPVILVGLALALDIGGAASGLAAAEAWGRIAAGVGLALTAGATFGLALVLTQHEAATVDGRLRTAVTMLVVGVVALVVAQGQGGLHWAHTATGWWGLGALTLLYGTAFTIMFSLLPRLGVVGHSPILNVEPVAALVMAWFVLGQSIAPLQIAGSLLVVGAVMALGLRR